MLHEKSRRTVTAIAFAATTLWVAGAGLPAMSQLTAAPPAAAQGARQGGAAGQPNPQGYRPQSKVNGVQIQEPMYEDTFAVLDALPDHAPATPKKPRKIFVFAKANGYAHSNIPLAAFTIKALGDKTKAWTTTTSYDLADFTAANLAQYDAIVLDNTTGAYLDDTDAAATEQRKKALLDFVRSGHGLVLLHAAGDSYHTNGRPPRTPNQTQAEYAALPQGQPAGTWPEYNKMIGGYFKWHWVYPQVVTVKIDDPRSPLTAMFHGQEFTAHDEIYTFAQDSFSRKNVHVLTSIDYAKMSDEDKAKEPAATKRNDGDYALSWIRREGEGRVFYEVLGHSEHIYSTTLLLEQILAGTQYALGDLKADDSPSMK